MDYNSVTQFYLILTTTIIPRDSPGRDFYIPRTRDIAPKREGDISLAFTSLLGGIKTYVLSSDPAKPEL